MTAMLKRVRVPAAPPFARRLLPRPLTLAVFALGLFSASAAAQTRTITGRVIDQTNGQPLIGAEVSLSQGAGAVASRGRAAMSTVTNTEGSFSIQVPEGAQTLTVVMIGYKRQDVPVAADANNITVSMETDPLKLDEIVVTGQATGVQRRNLANAVATVDASELNIVPSSSIESQLAGKIAGADVQANSGAPGGGNQINLRGVSTIIGNSTPLYVVDGIIVSDVTINSGVNSVTGAGGGISNDQDNSANRIADLNPADIANIEILKGASAAAIYGSQANNGVILITTKRGHAGETTFNLSQRFGAAFLSKKIGSRTFQNVDEAVAAFGPKAADVFTGAAYDHEEELAGDMAPAFETSLSVSGGTENTRYYASGLVHNEDGVVIGTGYDKYSAMLNLDQNIGSRLALGIRMNGIHTKTDRGFTNNDNTSTSYYMQLTTTPSFIDLQQRPDGTFPVNILGNSNPLETAALAKNDETVDRFIGGASLTLDAFNTGTQGLRLLFNGGADVFAQDNVVYAPEDLQFECQTALCTPIDPFPGTSVLGKSNSTFYNYNVNAVHSYTPQSIQLSATTSLGVQYEYRNLDIARVQTTDLFPGQQNIDDGVNRIPEQTRRRSKDLGVFAQEELLLFDRLLLTGSVRADRSSNNSDPDKWFVYPKAAGSYRLAVGNSVLDEVKFRVAYGESGNQPLYGQKFNTLNPGSLGGFQTLQLGGTTVSPDLHPERQKEIEGGVDLYLFGGRASAELTAYHKRVDDVLLQRALPTSTGFGSAISNSDGFLTTTGIEAALSAVPVQKGDFNWTSRTTFSTDKTMVDSLPVPPFNFAGGGFGTSIGAIRIQQGFTATSLFGRDTVAVVDDPRCLQAESATAGDGTCVPGHRFITKIGDSNPDFRMGFSNDFRYKSLSVNTTVDWQKGGNVVNLTGWLRDGAGTSPDFLDPCNLDGCQPDETLGQYRLRVYPGRVSTVWLEDASFVKLREVALSWDVPDALYSNLFRGGIDGLRLTLSGRNLVTITDYTGMDPEVNNFGSAAIRGNIDVAPYPPSRSFWLSLDVRF